MLPNTLAHISKANMMMNHLVLRVRMGVYEIFSPSADNFTSSGGLLPGSGSSDRSSVSTGTPNRRLSSTKLSIVGMA